jgi:hypothetical protein
MSSNRLTQLLAAGNIVVLGDPNCTQCTQLAERVHTSTPPGIVTYTLSKDNYRGIYKILGIHPDGPPSYSNFHRNLPYPHAIKLQPPKSTPQKISIDEINDIIDTQNRFLARFAQLGGVSTHLTYTTCDISYIVANKLETHIFKALEYATTIETWVGSPIYVRDTLSCNTDSVMALLFTSDITPVTFFETWSEHKFDPIYFTQNVTACCVVNSPYVVGVKQHIEVSIGIDCICYSTHHADQHNTLQRLLEFIELNARTPATISIRARNMDDLEFFKSMHYTRTETEHTNDYAFPKNCNSDHNAPVMGYYVTKFIERATQLDA